MLQNQSGQTFYEFKAGEMFGESDTLLDLPRNCKAVAKSNLSMMILTKTSFEKVIKYSQDFCFKMILAAKA